MKQLQAYQKHYLGNLQNKLWHKRTKHLKQMILLGKTRHLQSCDALTKSLFSSLSNSRQFKVNCILDLAQTMISDHLVKDPHSIIFMLKKLLKNIAEHADVEISAHPADSLVIKNNLGELNISVARKMIIIDDAAIKPGSLLIKANKSIIDAHLHTQVGRAGELLQN